MIRIYWQFRSWFVWTLVVATALVFTIADSSFTTLGNLFSVSESFAPLALTAVGLGVIMIAGEFDLSLAGVIPLAALLTVKLSVHGIVFGMVVAILAAIMVGLINGFLTSHYEIPSLAVTVGTLVLTIGLGFAVSSGDVVAMPNPETGLFLSKAVTPFLSLRGLVFLSLILLVAGLMRFTWFGVGIYSSGSDALRARALGVSRTRMLLLAFGTGGLFFGLTGSLQGLVLASGTAGGDQSLLLQAATAAIVGGVALSGGRGSVVGITGGALLLSVLSNGLSLLGASTSVVQLANGLLLLGVVLLDSPVARRLDLRMERVVQGRIEEDPSSPPNQERRVDKPRP
jgi:ribose transport system permease protein